MPARRFGETPCRKNVVPCKHCFLSGVVTARQLGADYPFQDAEARKWFNFFGRLMYGWRLRKA